jgi:hypothetical protein
LGLPVHDSLHPLVFLGHKSLEICEIAAVSVFEFLQEKDGNALAPRRKITKTKSMLRLLWLLSALLMSYVPSLVACEGCKEPSNVIGASGVGGIGASFSWSVLFMIGMLAFLMSGMVLMMIRSCRQLAAQRQRVAMESH